MHAKLAEDDDLRVKSSERRLDAISTMSRVRFESFGCTDGEAIVDSPRRVSRTTIRLVLFALLTTSIAACLGSWQRHERAADRAWTFGRIQEEATRSHRLILLHFASDESLASQQVDDLSIRDPHVQSLLDRKFVHWRLDDDSSTGSELAALFNVTTTPAFVVLTPAGAPLRNAQDEDQRRVGYVGPEELRAWLASVRGTRGARSSQVAGLTAGGNRVRPAAIVRTAPTVQPAPLPVGSDDDADDSADDN